MIVFELKRARDGKHKFKVKTDKNIVFFGAKDYSDYTLHKDIERKKRYIARHKSNEDWTKKGRYTAGFYSRWVLWNKPTLEESLKNIKKRFDIKILKTF